MAQNGTPTGSRRAQQSPFVQSVPFGENPESEFESPSAHIPTGVPPPAPEKKKRSRPATHYW